eukprot:PhM_4_TR16820/c2_g1_i12/m.47770
MKKRRRPRFAISLFAAASVRGPTIAQLQRPVKNLEDLLLSRPSCSQPTPVPSSVLLLSSSLKSRPSRRTRRALRRFTPTAATASPRQLARMSLSPPSYTPFKWLLENRRGTPCATVRDGRLVTDFQDVEAAFFNHFTSVWCPPLPPARDFPPCADTVTSQHGEPKCHAPSLRLSFERLLSRYDPYQCPGTIRSDRYTTFWNAPAMSNWRP